jgi:hypothetical protein
MGAKPRRPCKRCHGTGRLRLCIVNHSRGREAWTWCVCRKGRRRRREALEHLVEQRLKELGHGR